MKSKRRLIPITIFGVFILTGLLVWIALQPATIPVDTIADEPYYQNPALLEQAWAQPVADTYRPNFEYQINGAFCGPATVVNIFQSLGVDQYSQENIFDNTEVSYWKARVLGLTLDEMAELIEANGDWDVSVLRDLNLDEFRAHLRKANDLDQRYLINFNRAPLFGVVIGHHSPIGGYLEEEGLVFVLDVFDDYRPFLVPVERLFEAMDTIDSETDKKRGLIQVTVAH